MDDPVHFGHLEQLQHAAAHSGSDQPAAMPFAVDVVVDDRAHACRIHIGNLAEIQNDDPRRRIAAQRGLKDEKIHQGERAAETENDRAGSFAFLLFDGEGSVDGHSGTSV